MEENKKPENPNAFPSEYHNPHSGIVHTDEGMPLRDYFAAKAMSGIFASGNALPNREEHFINISVDAYRIADTMLKEREK